MLKKVFELDGYKIDMLTTTHRGIVDTGLKYVHNDTCYPALLVIGQLLEAVNSGKYDTHKLGLLITQTGGRLPRVQLHPSACVRPLRRRDWNTSPLCPSTCRAWRKIQASRSR